MIKKMENKLQVGFIFLSLMSLIISIYSTHLVSSDAFTASAAYVIMISGFIIIVFTGVMLIRNTTKAGLEDLADTSSLIKDKFKSLRESVNEASHVVLSSSDELVMSADEAVKGSYQVAATISEVAKSATDQATNIAETVEVLGQIVGSVEQLALAARESSKGAQVSASLVSNMVNSVNEMKERMDNISQISNLNGQKAIVRDRTRG